MSRPWIAAIGDLKGWLLAVGLCSIPIAVWYVATSVNWSRSRIVLDKSLGETILCTIPVQTVIGEFTDPGDAAEDYHHAVQECLGTQHYSGYMSLSASRQLNDPDTLDVRAPQYLLDGAKKANMDYTGRFAQPTEWTAARIHFVRAFDTIGMVCILKADLLAKAGKVDQAEALLKAVVAFGYHIERERIRFSQTITGLALQQAACRRLIQIYKDADQEGMEWTATQYMEALQYVQERLEAKAARTTAVLKDGSPLTAEMFWLLENDQDRMWRIEAVLRLGLTRWTAPRSADQEASRRRLAELSTDPDDPMLQEAARAALQFTREDVRKVR